MGLKKLADKIGSGLKTLVATYDLLELIIVACFGTILFVGIIVQIVREIWKSGSTYFLVGFSIFIAITISSIIRDIVRRSFGPISTILVFLWVLCLVFAGWTLL